MLNLLQQSESYFVSVTFTAAH